MSGVLLYTMAGIYLLSGVFHFLRPVSFVRIVPPLLPWKLPIVYISGAAEILLGVLLIPPATRPFAAWGLVFLLVAVFPANIYMAMLFTRKKHRYRWVTILRLPLQFVLIWWALQYT